MKRTVARLAAATVGALALTFAVPHTALAQDAVVATDYADGGFVSYGDKVWVEHYTSGYSTVFWYTDYGRWGSCTGSAVDGTAWCNYDMRETGRITLQICSYPNSSTSQCSAFVTARIGD